MEEKEMKQKSPRPSTSQAVPPVTVRKNLISSQTLGLIGTGTSTDQHSQQKTKFHRGMRDKPELQSQLSNQAAPIRHAFLTDMSDVHEMEKGLLSLLNDFHSGKLQAFGTQGSIDQIESVRKLQEKIAQMHFDLKARLDALPVDQHKQAADNNMDTLLLNLEELSSSIQKLNFVDNKDVPSTSSSK